MTGRIVTDKELRTYYHSDADVRNFNRVRDWATAGFNLSPDKPEIKKTNEQKTAEVENGHISEMFVDGFYGS